MLTVKRLIFTTNHTNTTNFYSNACRCSCWFVRTVGHLKVPLLLFQTAAFNGATLYGIIYPHGKVDRFRGHLKVRLFSVFVVEFFLWTAQPLNRRCSLRLSIACGFAIKSVY